MLGTPAARRSAIDRLTTRPVVVAARRTPFARAGGELRGHDALALAGLALGGLLDAVPREAGEAVDALRWGIVVLDPRIPHMAREVVLRSRLSPHVRAVTLTDNCITGIRAVADLVRSLEAGRARVAVAGGVESMSNPPLLFARRAARRFLSLGRARGAASRLRALLALRPGDFLPEPPAVAEPSTGLSMGEHCEQMVKDWGIGREAQDALALRSHRRAHEAAAAGLDADIEPVDGIAHDALVRADTSAERLAALAPVFDRTAAGSITAGNASPLTDGAAALLLGTAEQAERLGLEPLARIADFEFAAIAPADGLLMAPALAVPRLLARNGIGLDELDRVEIHEAFAGQVLCNLAAWERGWKEPAIGRLEPERINLHGGSIALGHPFAATGIRLVASLARQLQAAGARRGLLSVCGAGATAAAMLLERP